MKTKVFWSGLVLTLLSVATFALVANRIPGPVKVEAASDGKGIKKRATVLQEKSQAEVQALIIALRPIGFSPAQFELAEGRYLFIVQTRVRDRDVSFQLDREGGERLKEVQGQKLQWKQEFDLHPGTYVLSVVDHPKWRCVIIVKSR